MSRPDLTVVVPTYRRPALLARCLDALSAQALPADRFEVVVVDDGSADTTRDVLAARSDVVTALVQPRNLGPAAARNRGVDAARSDLVLFVDDDVVATPSLLSTHLAAHATAADPAFALLGRVDWHPDLTVTPFMRWLDRSGLQFGYDTWLQPGAVEPPHAAFYTANVSLRRDLLRRVGGFDERFPYPAFEDIDLAFRLGEHGLRLVYDPRAVAHHARAITLAEFRRRMHHVGSSAALLRAIRPEFPLDDADLVGHAVGRRALLARRLTAGRNDAARNRYYWSAVATSYVDGCRRAAVGA